MDAQPNGSSAQSSTETLQDRDALVIGAGPAGLATAAMLRKQGLRTLVVDRASRVGASWRARYDRLHLNTSRWFSHLPGCPFPAEDGLWPSRDAMVRYLERYAEHHRIELLLEAEVRRIERCGAGGWRVETSRGTLQSQSVVVATGPHQRPFVPDWPGRDRYAGELIHSLRYRNAVPYQNRDVLVVGAGDSGGGIAVDLAEGGAARVRLSVRTPPHIIRRGSAGVPTDLFGVSIRRLRLPPRVVDTLAAVMRKLTIGDLSPYGLTRPPQGLYSELLRRGLGPIVDSGAFIDAIKGGRVEIVGALDRFEDGQVVLADGSRIHPEAIIAATGYRPALEPLVGHVGVLRPDGFPAVHGRQAHPNAPGLHFIGFTWVISGHLREMRIDSRQIARAIAKRHLQRSREAGASVRQADPKPSSIAVAQQP